MRKLLTAVVIVMGCSAFSNIQAQEQDKKINRKNIPKAVEATVARESSGATIKGLGTENEGGKLTYELELIVDGLTRDTLIDKKGNILEVEQEVSMDSLSDDVRKGLAAAAVKGTVIKVVALSKKDKLVAYEAAVTTGKRRSEIQVGPDGKKLAHPE